MFSAAALLTLVATSLTACGPSDDEGGAATGGSGGGSSECPPDPFDDGAKPPFEEIRADSSLGSVQDLPWGDTGTTEGDWSVTVSEPVQFTPSPDAQLFVGGQQLTVADLAEVDLSECAYKFDVTVSNDPSNSDEASLAHTWFEPWRGDTYLRYMIDDDASGVAFPDLGLGAIGETEVAPGETFTTTVGFVAPASGDWAFSVTPVGDNPLLLFSG